MPGDLLMLGVVVAALAMSLTSARRVAAARARLAVKAAWLRFELEDDKVAVAEAFAAAEAGLQAVGRGACTENSFGHFGRPSLSTMFASPSYDR